MRWRKLLIALTSMSCHLFIDLAWSQTPSPDRVDNLRRRRTPVVEVFESCKDAVVNISTTQVIQIRTPFLFDTPFDQMFDVPNGPRTRELKTTAVGSGFVFHPSGYILTNAHVIAKTAERKVIFADKREFDAEVIAADAEKDLAVLKIKSPTRLPVLKFGRSDDLMIGETVIAIGNPVGLETTVTAGVISAINRNLEINQRTVFRGLIQTDASINPGNSGGPLLNALGELIGINTAMRSDAQNIGFAVAVDTVTSSLPKLLDVERRYHITVGLEVIGADKAVISKVARNSPAEASGLKVGEILHSVGGEPIAKAMDYYVAMLGKSAGTEIPIEFDRAGQRMLTKLIPEEMPKPDGVKLAKEKLGVDVIPLSPLVARKLGLPAARGVLVERVEADGPAAKIQMEPADILIEIGNRQLSNIDDLGQLLESVTSGQVVRVGVLRVANVAKFRLTAPLTVR